MIKILTVLVCLPMFTFSVSANDNAHIVVHFKDAVSADEISRFTQRHHLLLVRHLAFNPGTFEFQPKSAASIDVLSAVQQATIVERAYRPRKRYREKRVPDPYFSQQWHLLNTGQSGGCSGDDLNLQSVSEQGQDVVIAIVDDGVELSHPDLLTRTLAQTAYHYDYLLNDASPVAGEHGTAVAGLAAATADNGIGVRGVAPLTDLISVRLLGGFISDLDEANALGHYPQVVDVSNNSWGMPEDSAYLEGPGELLSAALSSGVEIGRQGLGVNYVWAGGNGGPASNSNFDGYANSSYVIAVAASDDCGELTYYSEPGANILVNAPSSSVYSSVFTTDISGLSGYNDGLDIATDTSDNNYTAVFGGTSATAPMVSGVVALMLNANPQLSWRDVRRILAETAYQNDPGHFLWQQNAASFWFNPYYGFGRVDALAAVNAAKGWIAGVPSAQTQRNVVMNPFLQIPEPGVSALQDSVQVSEELTVEDVTLLLTSDHSDWSDLSITLISPSGTRSVLSPGEQGGLLINTQGSWQYLSMAFYGESSMGNWTLELSDVDAGQTGRLQGWGIRLNGITIIVGRGDIAPLGAPDGKVTIADALVVLRIALGLQTLPDASLLSVVDLAPDGNPDGVITLADALIILRIALGLDV